MADANQAYFDAVLRHAIEIRRFSSGEVKKILTALNKADRDLVILLRRRLSGVKHPVNFKTKKMIKTLRDIRAARAAAMIKVKDTVTQDLLDLAKLEQEFEAAAIKASIPARIVVATASASALRAAVTEQLFAGGANSARNLSQWFASLSQADARRVVEAVQIGLAQGESIDDMVRRIAGTRAAGFSDGVLAMSRRNAAAVVRTAVNHVSNAAREALWAANADLIQALMWVSTLDGRTTRICMSRDGKFTALPGQFIPPGLPRLVPAGARPPAHVSCRSLTVATFSSQGLAGLAGNRPFVRSTQTSRFRQANFRADARATAGDRWSGMSRTQRNAAVRSLRDAWARDAIGQVPAKTTYGSWLRSQPAAFQDEVLGRTKGRLFRQGQLQIEKFVDRFGNELSLADLSNRVPDVFRRAGLDPEDFQ